MMYFGTFTCSRISILLLLLCIRGDAWTIGEKNAEISRRECWTTSTGGLSAIAATGLFGSTPSPAHAASGLAVKLAARDPAVLTNSIFNKPPAAQVYPEFMRGTWDIQVQFGGFLFPSKKISKERITQNVLIPGFQKCSIAAICDVGKDASYTMSIDPKTGLDDRALTLTSQIRGFLGYDAVREVLYNPKSNPNRISIDFVEYQTKNAERIELFYNARESESVPETGVFVCSEYLRQVTFGTGSEVGIPRQGRTRRHREWFIFITPELRTHFIVSLVLPYSRRELCSFLDMATCFGGRNHTQGKPLDGGLFGPARCHVL
jgi:hypothetical protein